MRKIAQRPVRAAMFDDPAHCRCTSYRANALGQADARLSPHTLNLSVGKSDKEGRRRTAHYSGRNWIVPPLMIFDLP